MDQVINGIKLDTWTAYRDFMASPVVDMGDACIVAYFEPIKMRLLAQSHSRME